MGGRLVCEFALLRQEETESCKVNSFPSGQTHVGFTNLYLRGIAATAERCSPGNCLRVASVKIKGWQYYSLTALISVLSSRNSGRCITTLCAVAGSYSKQQNPARITTNRVNTQRTRNITKAKSFLQYFQ